MATEMERLRADLEAIQTDLKSLRAEIKEEDTNVHQEIQEIQENIKGLRSEIKDLLDAWNTATGVLKFMRWLAGLVTAIGGSYAIYMGTKQ